MSFDDNITFTKEDAVYSKIGGALISAQRIEFLTANLLSVLEENGEIYGIMTNEFMANTEKSKKLRKKTLGQVFKLLKLNPKLVLSEELDKYVKIRNQLVHDFWRTHLNSKSDEQMWNAISFCYAFGRFSNRVEKFFKGFLYFLALRHVKDSDHLNSSIKQWKDSFDYFLSSLKYKTLQPIDGESIDKFDFTKH